MWLGGFVLFLPWLPLLLKPVWVQVGRLPEGMPMRGCGGGGAVRTLLLWGMWGGC